MLNHQAPQAPHPPRPVLAGQSRGRALVLVVAIIAAVLVAVGVVFLFMRGDPAPEPPVAGMAQPPAPSAPPQRSPRGELPADDPLVADAEEPKPPAMPATDAEGPVGVHAFPPLGTRPNLTGIIVPEDFELPPGYIRHFQSTDDGQMLVPILMFDPDNPPLDEFGQPMEIPPDRVVPPEMAPAGLPIEILELPEPREPDSSNLRRLLRSG